MNESAVATFFAYVRRRRTFMAVGGAAAVLAGAIGVAVHPGGAGEVWLGGLVLLGVLVGLGATAGASLVKDGRRIAGGPAVKMDLTTWPYRTVRSPVKNRVLVTLDVAGSAERTPLAEFKAVWYTPGLVNEPTRSADVFGAVERGQTVLAVAEDGSCYLGRVSEVRQGQVGQTTGHEHQ